MLKISIELRGFILPRWINLINMNIEEIIAHIVTVENGFQHILDAIHYRFLEKEKRGKQMN